MSRRGVGLRKSSRGTRKPLRGTTTQGHKSTKSGSAELTDDEGSVERNGSRRPARRGTNRGSRTAYFEPPSSGRNVSYTNSQYRGGHWRDDTNESSTVGSSRSRRSGFSKLQTSAIVKDIALPDDARISKQLRRLLKEDNPAVFATNVAALNESLALQENLSYVQRAAHHLLDDLVELLHKAPTSQCRLQAAHTMAFVGHLLQAEDVRYINVIINGLESKSESFSATNYKVLLLTALKKTILFDKHKINSVTMSDDVFSVVMETLELTQTMPLMVASVEVVRAVYSVKPDLLQSYFQDLVDILVGWHIDHEQPAEVTHYVAHSLSSFPELWRSNVECAVTLLSQFMEDFNEYYQEVVNNYSSNTEEDSGVLQVNVVKLEYFLSVFSSVLESVTPDKVGSWSCLLTPFLKESFASIVKAVKFLFTTKLCSNTDSSLLKSVNKVCHSMHLLGYGAEDCEDLFLEVFRLQTHSIFHSTNSVQISFLNLCSLLLTLRGEKLPLAIIEEMFGPESPLRVLRFSHDQCVWEASLAVCQAALGLRNIPLLQEVYRYILADLQLCHDALFEDTNVPSFGDTSLLNRASYGEREAVTVWQYHLCAIAQLCRARNSLISTWALQPSLLQLLAVFLTPDSPTMASSQPQLHLSLVTLLSSHCRAHSNFISSSSLIVDTSAMSGLFKIFSQTSTTLNPSAAEFNPKGNSFTSSLSISREIDAPEVKSYSDSTSGFGETTTSQNLAIIINVIRQLLNLGKLCPESSLKVTLRWLKDVFSGLQETRASGERLLNALRPLLEKLLDLAQEPWPLHIIKELCQILHLALPFISTLTELLTRTVSLTLTRSHTSTSEDESDLFFSLLYKLSLVEVVSAIVNLKTSGTEMNFPYVALASSRQHHIGIVSGGAVRCLLLHHQLHSTEQPSMPPPAFHQIINFILDDCATDLHEDLLQTVVALCLPTERPQSPSLQEMVGARSEERGGEKQHIRRHSIEKFMDDAAVARACCYSLPVLWRVICWQMAQHCVQNRLRSSIGKPQDMFLLTEVAVKVLAKRIRDCGVETNTSNVISDSAPSANRKQQAASTAFNLYQHPLLRVQLVMEFLDALECCIMFGGDGCCSAVQTVNKHVRVFFTLNRDTCIDGLARLRHAVAVVALNAGNPHIAARHADALLLALPPDATAEDVEKVAVLCARAYVALHSPDSVLGLQKHCFVRHGLQLSWLSAAVHAAAYKYEMSLHSMQQVLTGETQDQKFYTYERSPSPAPPLTVSDFNLSGDVFSGAQPCTQEFIIDLVSNGYRELCCFQEALAWSTERAQDTVNCNSGFLNYLSSEDSAAIHKALSQFDNFEYGAMTQTLTPTGNEQTQNINDWPLWRTLDRLELNALRCLNQSIYEDGKVLSQEDLLSLSSNSRKQAQLILRLLSASEPQPELHVRLLMLQHIFLQTEGAGVSKSELPAGSVLHDGWNDSNLRVLPSSTLPMLTRYTKMIAQFNKTVDDAGVSSLEMVCIRQSRKQCNYGASQQHLLRLLTGGTAVTAPLYSSEILAGYLDSYGQLTPNCDAVFISQLVMQGCKLLYSGNATHLACSALTRMALQLYPRLLATSTHLNELFGRSVLNIAKWVAADALNYDTLIRKQVGQSLKAVCLKENPSLYKSLTFSRNGVLPITLADSQQLVGNCLLLAASQCPNIAKIWYRLGSWSFKMGRVVVDGFLKGDTPLLSPIEESQVGMVLSSTILTTAHEVLQNLRIQLLGALSWLPSPDLSEDLNDEEELADLNFEDCDVLHVHIKQMIANVLCADENKWLVNAESIDEIITKLVGIRNSAIQRHYELYTIAAQSYFKFLAAASTEESKHEAPLCSAVLRLMRLVVKHATQLRPVLEHAFLQFPTKPWKTIIPQLFARLNHSEGWVRESIIALLCRLAEDWPHLIVVPSVVGSTVPASRSANTTDITDMLAKYLQQTEDKSKDDESPQAAAVNEIEDDFELPEEGAGDEDGADEQLSLDKEVMHHSCSQLVEALTRQNVGGMQSAKILVHELRRITVLWDELWLGTLSQYQSDLSRRQLQLLREASKLESNRTLSSEDKENLIKTKYEVIFKPVLLVLEQLASISSTAAETPHEKNFQSTYSDLIADALKSLKEPESYSNPKSAVNKLNKLLQMLQQQRSNRRGNSSYTMQEISPVLAAMQDTDVAMPAVLGRNGQIVRIQSVSNNVSILPSKTKPKKLSFVGDDGHKYTYLFKGMEDLHLDERIMQFLAITNTMLGEDDAEGLYRANHYSVVPLGPRSGLIQWVDNATPLYSLYVRWQHREAQTLAYKNNTTVKPVLRPSELYFNKLTPRLEAAGFSVNNRREWPPEIVEKVVDELIKETPADLISRELMATSTSAADWWLSRRTFSISTAVMSMVGYVLGLGDRHLDNLLVRLTSGEVIHIDYNICFEKGRFLRVPEHVPYRMTQNIEHALGATGVEGIFRSSSERVLAKLRQGKEVLLTLLETFIYDPLVDWTHDADAGYTSAMYGGDTLLASTVRQRRLQMERVLTVTMFKVRAKEMTAQWRQNKSEVEGHLTKLSDLFTALLVEQNKREAVDDEIKTFTECKEYLEAGTDSNHPANTLLQRYKEYNKASVKKEAAFHSVTELSSQMRSVVLGYELALEGMRASKTLQEVWTKNCTLELSDAKPNNKKEVQQADKVKQIRKDLQKTYQHGQNLLKDLCHSCEPFIQLVENWPREAEQQHLLLKLSENGSLLCEGSVDAAVVLGENMKEGLITGHSKAEAEYRWLQRMESLMRNFLSELDAKSSSLGSCDEKHNQPRDVMQDSNNQVDKMPDDSTCSSDPITDYSFQRFIIDLNFVGKRSPNNVDAHCRDDERSPDVSSVLGELREKDMFKIDDFVKGAEILGVICNEIKASAYEALIVAMKSARTSWRSRQTELLPALFSSLSRACGPSWEKDILELSHYPEKPDLPTDCSSQCLQVIASHLKCDRVQYGSIISLLENFANLEDSCSKTIHVIDQIACCLNVKNTEIFLNDSALEMLNKEYRELLFTAQRACIVSFLASFLRLHNVNAFCDDAVTEEEREKCFEQAFNSLCRYKSFSLRGPEVLLGALCRLKDRILSDPDRIAILRINNDQKCFDNIYDAIQKGLDDIVWQKRSLSSFCNLPSAIETEGFENSLASLNDQIEKMSSVLDKLDQLKSSLLQAVKNACLKQLKPGLLSNEVAVSQSLCEQTDAVLSPTRQFLSNADTLVRWAMTRNPDSIAAKQVLSQFADVVTQFQKTMARLTKQSPSTLTNLEQKLVTLSPPDKRNAKRWLQQVSAAVHDKLSDLQETATEESINNAVAAIVNVAQDLRQLFVHHHKLVADMRNLLRSLSKFKDRTGAVVRIYLSHYRSYASRVTELIGKLQSGDFLEETKALRSQMSLLFYDTDFVYSHLMVLCEEPDFSHYLKMRTEMMPQTAESQSKMKDSDVASFLPQHFDDFAENIPDELEDHSVNEKRQQFKRVISCRGSDVEHNPYALSVWRGVKAKIEGTTDASAVMAVADQVDQTIKDSKSMKLLSSLYEGWTAWV